MRLVLELHGIKHVYESDNEDYSAGEMKEIFSRMLVQATYPPSVIAPAEGGHYECEYVEEGC